MVREIDTALLSAVASFVARVSGCPIRKINARSQIEKDLGITGDDAIELMQAFAEEFEADLAGMEFCRHFGLEGFDLFGAQRRQPGGGDYGVYPITISHLARLAKERRWSLPDRVTQRPGTYGKQVTQNMNARQLEPNILEE